MSYAPAAHCDVCGEPRRQTNHWFQARVRLGRLVIEPFNADSTRVKHLCGEACVGRFVSGSLALLCGVATETAIEFPLRLESPADVIAEALTADTGS